MDENAIWLGYGGSAAFDHVLCGVLLMDKLDLLEHLHIKVLAWGACATQRRRGGLDGGARAGRALLVDNLTLSK